MKQEQKHMLSALLKTGWMPICGGLLGLVIGLLFLFVGFWKTLLLLALIVAGAISGWFVRRRVNRTESLNGFFVSSARDHDDDIDL